LEGLQAKRTPEILEKLLQGVSSPVSLPERSTCPEREMKASNTRHEP
jgi:hypothetical protein